MIQFTIPGDVQAQQRPRVTKKGAFDPRESKDYKSFVRLVAAEHAPEQLITAPIKLTIDVYRKIPKSFSKKKHQQALDGVLVPKTRHR